MPDRGLVHTASWPVRLLNDLLAWEPTDGAAFSCHAPAKPDVKGRMMIVVPKADRSSQIALLLAEMPLKKEASRH